MVIYYIADVSTTEPFHTPAALQALLFEGPDAVRGATIGVPETLQFTLLHFAAWILAGTFASLMVSATEAFRWGWYLVVVGRTVAFCGFIWATGAWRIDGFDSNHLWIGAILGSAAMAVFLAWRHPQVLDRT